MKVLTVPGMTNDVDQNSSIFLMVEDLAWDPLVSKNILFLIYPPILTLKSLTIHHWEPWLMPNSAQPRSFPYLMLILLYSERQESKKRQPMPFWMPTTWWKNWSRTSKFSALKEKRDAPMSLFLIWLVSRRLLESVKKTWLRDW